MEEGSNGSRKSGALREFLTRLIYGRPRVTEDKIQEIIDASEEEGIINEEENDMIRSILGLRDTVVREIMIPRTGMSCVPIDASSVELLDAIITCGHSRIPVYEGTIDNIVGLVYAKDLLKFCGMENMALDMRHIMRQPYYIPESKNLEELLQEFKKKRVHIAIVIDEYGGTSGLVTIEDLLEQIVGDIQDEYDVEEELLHVNPDGSLTVDARLPIEELEEHLGIEIAREKFDSVGGLIFHITGRIPRAGEEVESDTLRLSVLEADERKIRRVRVVRKSALGDEAEG